MVLWFLGRRMVPSVWARWPVRQRPVPEAAGRQLEAGATREGSQHLQAQLGGISLACFPAPCCVFGDCCRPAGGRSGTQQQHQAAHGNRGCAHFVGQLGLARGLCRRGC